MLPFTWPAVAAANGPAAVAAPGLTAPPQTMQETLAALQWQQSLGNISTLWTLQALQTLATQRQLLALGSALLGAPGEPERSAHDGHACRCPTCGSSIAAICRPGSGAPSGTRALRRGDGQQGSITYV